MEGSGRSDEGGSVNQESLVVKQLQIEEQLLELKARRQLNQRVVDPIDAEGVKQMSGEQARRTRLAMDRTSGRALLARRREVAASRETDEGEALTGSPGGSAPISSLLRPVANRPLELEGKELQVGTPVWVKDDLHLVRSHASPNSVNIDYTKELYCGEKGKIVKLYPLLPMMERGVDVKFLDQETRFFTLPCLELSRGSSAAAERRLLTAAKAAGVKTDEDKKSAKPAAPAAKGSGSTANAGAAGPEEKKPPRRAGVTDAGAAARKPAAKASASVRSKSEAVAPAAKATQRSRSAVGVKAAAAATTVAAPAAAEQSTGDAAAPVVVGQRIQIVQNGKTVTATVQFVGDTEFAPGEWVGLELATPDGKNDGTVKEKAYFKCKPNHGLFRRANELGAKEAPAAKPAAAAAGKEVPAARQPMGLSQGIRRVPPGTAARKVADAEKDKAADEATKPKPRAPARPLKVTPVVMASTRTVRLWENGQYGSTVDSIPFKTMAIRPVHKTLKSVLIAAARELGWHLLKRPVEILFFEDGREVKELADICNGDNLIASWGETLLPPDKALPRMAGVKEQERPARHVDPMADAPATSARGAAPARPPASTPQRAATRANDAATPPPGIGTRTAPIPTFSTNANRIVKVFENGVYGSRWSDSVPCFTVTVRSTFKTIGSVKTMLARELKWNAMGRKVDAIYNTLGEELPDVDCICSGDVLIASGGDAFIKPHTDMAERFPAPRLTVAQHEAGVRAADVAPETSPTKAAEEKKATSPARAVSRAAPAAAGRRQDNKENTSASVGSARTAAAPKASKVTRPLNSRTNSATAARSDMSASQTSSAPRTPATPASPTEFPKDLGALSTKELLAESKKLASMTVGPRKGATSPEEPVAPRTKDAVEESSTRQEIDKLLAEIAALETKCHGDEE